MSLFFKLAAAITVILGFSLALIVLLNFAKFEHTLVELEQSRLRVLALEAKGSIESAIDLGLALPAAQDAQRIIAGISATDPDIRGVVVLAHHGGVLFQSGPHATSDLPDSARERAAWFEAAANTRGGTWTHTTAHALLVGTPILSPFNQPLGLVLIAYDRQSLDRRSTAFLQTFARQALWILAGGLSLACVVLWLLLSPLGERFRELEAELRRLGGPDPAAPADEELRAFQGGYQDASLALAWLEKSLEGI